MAKEIVYFAEFALAKYYVDAIMNIDLSSYPEPLREILSIVQIKGAAAAPAAVNEALWWVYNTQISFTPPVLIQEMEAIGEGICSTLGHNCNVTEMQVLVKRMNMFPELIKMACTAFGE